MKSKGSPSKGPRSLVCLRADVENGVDVVMIELGLGRIARLLQHTPLPWRAIHVAGTNGKGSVCAYASAMLSAAGIKCGRFNSPHLIDRWDCITIDEKTVDESVFKKVGAEVEARNKREDVRASEFELLTATAFEIFAREKIDVGVVEVGMGGRLDATNIIENPFVTIVTKIGLDHQAFLGDTLEDIAYQKAGIIKPGVPCVVDGTNSPEVIEVLQAGAKQVVAMPFTRVPQDINQENSLLWSTLRKEDFEQHQQTNISLAFEAVKQIFSQLRPPTEPKQVLAAVRDTVWPGRLQTISLSPITGRKDNVLLDGAHNVQSVEVLSSYVNHRVRMARSPVTWVVAFSKGKDLRQMLSAMVMAHDNVVAVEFSAVDGMPWVQAADADDILRAARRVGIQGQTHGYSGNVKGALCLATELSIGGSLVVAGSLYLVSDILRLLRSHKRT